MPAKTNRQIETDKRRQHLLEVAVRAFLELGYQRAGIREIAKRAGVSLGNLYNHFPSKEAVLIEIARLESLEVTPFIEQLQVDRPPQDRLRIFLETYLRHASKKDNVLLAVEILAEAVRTPAVAEAFATTRRSLIAGLSKCLAALDPSDMSDQTGKARLAIDIVEAHARHIVFSGAGFSEREISTVLEMVGSGVAIDLVSRKAG